PATATVTGPVAADNPIGSPAVSFEYFSGNTAGSAGTGTGTAPTDAGTYTVRASYAGNNNYNSSSATKTIQINPVNTQVNITWADPQAYNGNTHPATATVTGPVAADNPIGSPAVSFEYFSGNTAGSAGTGTGTAPTDAGTYTVRASYAGNNNYNSSSATKTIQINPVNTQVNITWADPQAYNGNTHPATATVTGPVAADNPIGSPAVSFEYFSGNTAGSAGTGTGTAPTDAGTYTVRASYAGNNNYNSSSATKTIQINPVNTQVNITWADPQAYNGNTHPATATVTGPVAADNPIGSPAVSFEYFSGNTAGSAGTGTGTAPTDAGTYTVRASYAGNNNYNSSSATKTIQINPVNTQVNITWADPQAYNGNTHPATATVTGPVAADNPIGSPAVSFEYFSGNTAGSAGTGTGTAPTDAGTYTVRASYAGNNNYNSSSATKTIQINPVNTQVNITWADPQAYNGNTHPATATVTGPVAADNPIGSPAVSFEYFSGNTAGSAGTGTSTAPTNAGTYTVRASYAGNNNYNSSSATKTIQINPVNTQVNITWADPQAYNGKSNPATSTVPRPVSADNPIG